MKKIFLIIPCAFLFLVSNAHSASDKKGFLVICADYGISTVEMDRGGYLTILSDDKLSSINNFEEFKNKWELAMKENNILISIQEVSDLSRRGIEIIYKAKKDQKAFMPTAIKLENDKNKNPEELAKWYGYNSSKTVHISYDCKSENINSITVYFLTQNPKVIQ